MKFEQEKLSQSETLVTDPLPPGWVETFKPGLISIVIPTYNHAHFLVDAVGSALAQTYPLIEVIVVDDGSTDDTALLMQTYEDPVRYIRQENRGLSGARNSGILAARGEFVALLDADDYWQPTYLQTVHKVLVKDAGLGAVHTGMHFVDAQGKVLAQPGVATVAETEMYERLLDGEFFAPSAVLVRRWVFGAVGLFDLELRASEDWDFWLRVARFYRFAGVAEPLLNYRVHGNNMSSDPAHMLHYQLLTLEKHFGKAEGDPAHWRPELQRAFAAVAYFAAQGYYLRGDQEKGTYYLHQALETNPALTQSLDIFYELGCVDQPLGRRGDPSTLNLQKNAQQLLTSLETIFRAPDVATRLLAQRQSAFAHAYRALGTLAYNSGHRTDARRFLLQALVHQPEWALQQPLLTMLAKTLVPSPMLRHLQTLRGTV